jgi:hypothetical protein
MKTKAVLFRAVTGIGLCLALAHCGVATYPGQPGFATNSYSKIDLEYLDTAGLFFYEVSYDNRAGGAGVGAIVTKLYPGARTYTSNVRTNADGALYRAKGQYDGAKVEMIAMPKINQIYVAPDSEIQFLIDYEDSLDEVDDANVAEKGIFTGAQAFARLGARAMNRAMDRMKQRLQLLKAASLKRDGSLAYAVTEAKFGSEVWKPVATVNLETTFFLNAVRTDLTPEMREELAKFVEAKFPKGFKGEVSLAVKGATAPLKFRLGVHTVKTAQASGIKVISKSSQEEMQEVLASLPGRIQ